MEKFHFLAAFLLLSMIAGAQDFRFGKVSLEEVQEKVHPLDKEADAAVLYRNQTVNYEYDGTNGFTLVTDVHERIKIYTKEGFDWATEKVSYYKNSRNQERVTNIKGYTYNLENGKVVEDKLSKNGIFEEEQSIYREITKFTMPAVKEGSVIEYRYSIRSPFVTSIDDTPLQYTIPINRLEVQVSIPEYLAFTKYLNPKSPLNLPVVQSSKPFVHTSTATGRSLTTNTTRTARLEFMQNVYSINKDNVPALKDEDYVDYLYNYAAYIKWELVYTKFPNAMVENYAKNWEGVAKSIFDDGGFQKEVNRDGFFKDDVDQVVQGITAPLEKAAAIYAFVKEKVRWNNNYGFIADRGGKAAFKKGEGNVGDINLLLTAMLKYAGLNASPVVVSTRSNGIPVYPTRSGFNYVISAIELPTGYVLLDATEINSAFGELPLRARNWQGRIIREDATSDWVDLNPHLKSEERLGINVELGSDMIIRGKSMNSYNGLFAKKYRDNFKDVKEESLLEHYEKGKGVIKITGIHQDNLTAVGTDVKETYDFELQQGVDVISDKVYLKPLAFNAMKENPFKADERIYPVFFEFPMLKSSVVNLLIPEGYEVESLPENFIANINGGEGEYKFVVKQNGRFLRVESELNMNSILFMPANYPALKEFYAQMVEKQSEAIVLRKI